jgi:hypothetical protein
MLLEGRIDLINFNRVLNILSNIMEECYGELTFEKSYLTNVLKVFSGFISAYSGFIVFGQTFAKSYRKNQYFKYSVFEIYKLYIAIIQILTFFTQEEPLITSGIILDKERPQKTVYYWKGVILTINGINTKIIILGSETEHSENNFKIEMSFSELHNFIRALKAIVPMCLCLNAKETEVICATSILKIDELKKLKKYEHAKVFVEQFLEDNTKNQETFKFIQIIHYYFEVILVLNKLTSMSQFDENIFEEILSA